PLTHTAGPPPSARTQAPRRARCQARVAGALCSKPTSRSVYAQPRRSSEPGSAESLTRQSRARVAPCPMQWRPPASTRAAWRAFEVPRIVRSAIELADGLHIKSERRGVGLADDDRPCGPESA